METINIEQPINLKVVRFEFDFSTLLQDSPSGSKVRSKEVKTPEISKQFAGFSRKKVSPVPLPPQVKCARKNKTPKQLVEELLEEIYSDQKEWSSANSTDCGHGHLSRSSTAASPLSRQASIHDHLYIEREYLQSVDIPELRVHLARQEERLRETGEKLSRKLRARDRLRRQQNKLCAAFTILLRHITGEHGARFGLSPGGTATDGLGAGEGGFSEWLHAMRLVARLPAGVPQHFRRKLWLTLADRHLSARGVDWPTAERACFRGTAQPEDTELGSQILKDLHRTGCSLFCGKEGRENQAMLRRVLLAYARWNKDVGYCQGFNMLAAIILEVMDKSESDSLKVMIYLVEAVLPEGYFADDLRGLSADMAAFRDLLRLRIPKLAQHMDHLQKMSDGGGVEPPLPDVFTMQWFLTLYATWLQRESLLRIWDLILLDGNEILLLTALAIWDMLQDRILSARSADEYYSCMVGGASSVWESGESLVARVVALGSAPELPRLRNLHRYRVTPPAPAHPIGPPNYHPPIHSAMQTMTKKGLRLFYSEDEGDSSDDGNKMALATVAPRRDERLVAGDRLSLDIGALKRQYARLRERQRQAHVILAAACARHAAVGVPTSPTSLTVNNLLLGKSAIVSNRGRRLGPPVGAIPPSRHSPKKEKSDGKRHTDTISWSEEQNKKILSRRNSMKWKDIKKIKDVAQGRKPSIDMDEMGDGVIVSEHEANQMIASVRSRNSSASSSYSSRSSSSDTSLCDDNAKDSDSEPDLAFDSKTNKCTESSTISQLPVRESAIGALSPVVSNNNRDKSDEGISSLNESVIRTTAASPPLLVTDTVSSYHCRINLDREKECDELLSSLNKNVIRVTSSPPTLFKESYISSSPSMITTSNNQSTSEELRHANYFSDFREKVVISDSLLEKDDTRYKFSTPRTEDSYLSSDYKKLDKNELLDNFNLQFSPKPTQLSNPPRSPIRVTDLSPIDLSPCNFGVGYISPLEYNYEANYSETFNRKLGRPSDIIDTLTMYPDFVPDIDLSDKDYITVTRSPGAESLVVSEDETPIPLKIDEYFEDSPEFFGARITVTDPKNTDIASRRPHKRHYRPPKKPDSLTLQYSHNEKYNSTIEETERASSLPKSLSISTNMDEFTSKDDNSKNINEQSDAYESIESVTSNIIYNVDDISNKTEPNTSKDHSVIQSGRKNSERALEIIQENSKILSRILTKQSISNSKGKKSPDIKLSELTFQTKAGYGNLASPLLRESTSDSLLGQKVTLTAEGSETTLPKTRPVSIDDPFSFDINKYLKQDDHSNETQVMTRSESLENRTDLYGWENKGFLAKCDYKSHTDESITTSNVEHSDETIPSKSLISPEWRYSEESKPSLTLPLTDFKDSLNEQTFSQDSLEFNISKSRHFNDSDYKLHECTKTSDSKLRISENVINSQTSDFSNIVTSSISFTYERSADGDSPIGAKTNSSDTLCQITSLDQVSTPISPKLFPKDTPTFPKDYLDKSDKLRYESDDTCSAITSLIETDTLSSLSYPRSPSTGSYHPFPTRPALRMPKELGIRLGMYPKDTNSSPK